MEYKSSHKNHWLCAARSATKLSLREIAEKTGISKGTLIKIENYGNFEIPHTLANNLQKLVVFYEKEHFVEFVGDVNNPGVILHNQATDSKN